MKLKTLKDFFPFVAGVVHFKKPKTIQEFLNWINGERKVRHKEIKEEAIKWVKHNSDLDIESERTRGMVTWTKHFFNITEEDLK